MFVWVGGVNVAGESGVRVAICGVVGVGRVYAQIVEQSVRSGWDFFLACLIDAFVYNHLRREGGGCLGTLPCLD